jgi:polyphenol oxidase
MIRRIDHDNGVVTYQSDLLRDLGVRHAFSTRIGGVSAPPYDTLNLGYLTKGTAPDHNTDVAENFRRLRRAIGLQRYFRVQVRQVHGAGVYISPRRPARMRDVPPADAILSDVPGSMPTVRTADCVPVLLAGPGGRIVGAVHAGWRGIVAGVITTAIDAMAERFGVDGRQVVAAIGPCIRAKAFEVGEEVVQAFAAAGLVAAVQPANGHRPHIDLIRAVELQLWNRGVQSTEAADGCTFHDATEFFSHRRDRGQTGRMAAVIAPTCG